MATMYDEAFIERIRCALHAILTQWDLSEATELRLLTLSENVTFLAKDPVRQNPVILRVHRPNYHSRTEIESELAWINALRTDNILDTPALVPLRVGGYIASVPDELQTRHVVGFEFIEGKAPDVDAQLAASFELLGQTSAKLHGHAQNWRKPAYFSRKTWDFESAFGVDPLWGDWRAAPGLTPEGQATLEELCMVLKDKLDNYGKISSRYGLIHADLRLANLILKGRDLVVIDFDDCGSSWFVYDFASAISFHELSPMIPALQEAWLKGYKSLRPLTAEDEAMLPTFILFRRHLLTAWIASHAETPTAAEVGMADYTEGTITLARRYLETNI